MQRKIPDIRVKEKAKSNQEFKWKPSGPGSGWNRMQALGSGFWCPSEVRAQLSCLCEATSHEALSQLWDGDQENSTQRDYKKAAHFSRAMGGKSTHTKSESHVHTKFTLPTQRRDPDLRKSQNDWESQQPGRPSIGKCKPVPQHRSQGTLLKTKLTNQRGAKHHDSHTRNHCPKLQNNE